jgi:uncharacterized membrane protein YedE/YeeE
MSVLAPLVIGIAFGWLLDRAELTSFHRIVGVYRLRDFTVLKFLGTAIVTGALTVLAIGALGFSNTVAVTPTTLLSDAVGGALFGVGMSLAGFCPGTIVAGAAGGRLDYLVAGGLGLVAGALAYGATFRWVGRLGGIAALGIPTLPAMLGVSDWLFVVVLAELATIGFYALERYRG